MPSMPPLSMLVVTQDVMNDMLRQARREGAEDVLNLLQARELATPDFDYLITAGEAATILGISEDQVRRLSYDGHFRRHVVGERSVRYSNVGVRAYKDATAQ